MIKKIQSGDLVSSKNTIVDGKLWSKQRLVILKSSKFIAVILLEGYDSKLGGHSGVLKTLKRVQRSFFWEGMYKQIQKYVAVMECVKRINIQLCHLLSCFSLFQFQRWFGKILKWISWKVYRHQMGLMSFWW